MPLVIARHLRYAWLEYLDARDAIAFDRTFSSASLGWINLFLDLADDLNEGKVDVSNQTPKLDIRWVPNPDNPREKGLIARPKGAHRRFLERWIVNPGVNRARAANEPPPASGSASTLTAGADATDVCDLLAISGHGAIGEVWGNEVDAIDVAGAFEDHINEPASGRLKYLLVPTCGNCGDFTADKWLPALQKRQPLHGVLGYSGNYTGDREGAASMRAFGDVMKKIPMLTVLVGWSRGNDGLPWGAVVHDAAARNDTVERWHSAAGLPPLPPGSTPRAFDSNSFPKGTEIVIGIRAMDLHWIHEDGTVIDRTNNRATSSSPAAHRFLSPGARGALRLRNNHGNFQKGARIAIRCVWVRPTKPPMSFDTLLDFDAPLLQSGASAPPAIEFVPDKGDATKRNGLIVTAPSSDTDVITLGYRVKGTALAAYTPIDDGITGFFFFRVLPPGFLIPLHTSTDAAFLK
ncbi:MAG: hypothetical protein WKG00_18785 [Polyangiaceae bacterium]